MVSNDRENRLLQGEDASQDRLAQIAAEMELLGRDHQAEKIRRFRAAGSALCERLKQAGIRADHVSFNPTSLYSPLGTVYLETDEYLASLSDSERRLAEELAQRCVSDAFPGIKIQPVCLAWDSFEMIQRQFGGSYDRYFASL